MDRIVYGDYIRSGGSWSSMKKAKEGREGKDVPDVEALGVQARNPRARSITVNAQDSMACVRNALSPWHAETHYRPGDQCFNHLSLRHRALPRRGFQHSVPDHKPMADRRKMIDRSFAS